MNNTTLKPNVLQMLEIARECGLIMLGEAYSNYMLHYDCFFLISDIENQQNKFFEELKDYNLLEEYDNKWTLLNISIEHAIDLVKK